MADNNTVNKNIGFAQSVEQSDTVANTETVTSILDLGAQYFIVRVSIDDCDNIAADTTMTFTASPYATGATFYELWDINGKSQVTTGTLPTTARAISFPLRDGVGIRRIKCTFGVAVTGDVVVRVQGIDSGIAVT